VTKKRDRPKNPKRYKPKPGDKLFRLTYGLRVYVARQTGPDANDAFAAFLQHPKVKQLMEELGVGKLETQLARVEIQRDSSDPGIVKVRKQLLGPDEKPIRSH